MRAAAATIAAVLGVVVALAAAVLWTAGRDTLDEDRFATHAVASLVSTPGREALTVTLARELQDPATSGPVPSEVYAVAREAVDAIASARVFSDALSASLAAAYRGLVDHPGDTVVIDLGALRDRLAAELEDIDPAIAARLPPASELDGVTVTTGLTVPRLPLRRLVGHVPLLVGLLALAAAALIAVALALSARPGRTARLLASALVVCAVVPAAIGLAVPRIAENAVAAPADQLARDLAERLLGQWLPATSALAVAAAALFALGTLRGGEGPRIPRRAG